MALFSSNQSRSTGWPGVSRAAVSSRSVMLYRKALLLPDQDVISALYGDRILRLNPWRYNMTERLLTAALLTPGHPVDLEWVLENSAIVHYCGRNKPWKPNYLGKLDCVWQQYADLVRFQPPKEAE